MNDFIKNLVNYVIEAKIKDYRGDQSAEVYRLSRINREISPSDAPADKGSKFAKINADYKEEKRLERAPRGPQTRPVVKKPMEEGIVDAASRGIEAVDNALGNPLTRGIRKQGEKDRAKLKDMMDNKGAKGKITREPANPFSKGDWQSRKERMDKAIDG